MTSDFDKLVELTEKIIDQEKRLVKNQDKVRSILDTTTDGFWDWHINDDYEYMSPKFWTILGQDPTTKKHHPSEWMNLLDKEQLQVSLTSYDEHVKSRGEKPYKCVLKYKLPNGKEIKILCRGRVIEWDGDKPVRMVGTHTDITDLNKG